MLQKELIIFYLSLNKIDHSLKNKAGREKIDANWHSEIPWCPHLLWSNQINDITTNLIQALDLLSKLRNIRPSKALKMTYHSFFSLPTMYRNHLWGQYKLKIKQKLQNIALRKIMYKKQRHYVNQFYFYKGLEILKFPDLVYLKNRFFWFQIETDQKLLNYFNLKHCGDNHNYRNLWHTACKI